MRKFIGKLNDMRHQFYDGARRAGSSDTRTTFALIYCVWALVMTVIHWGAVWELTKLQLVGLAYALIVSFGATIVGRWLKLDHMNMEKLNGKQLLGNTVVVVPMLGSTNGGYAPVERQIICTSTSLKYLLRHELVHSVQHRILGDSIMKLLLMVGNLNVVATMAWWYIVTGANIFISLTLISAMITIALEVNVYYSLFKKSTSIHSNKAVKTNKQTKHTHKKNYTVRHSSSSEATLNITTSLGLKATSEET